MDSGNVLAIDLDLSHKHSFNSWDEVGKVRDILYSGGSAGHEVVPVCYCNLGISQPKWDVTELHLLWVLTSLAHDLVQDNSLLEHLVGCSHLVGEFSTGINGVQGKVHNWRKLVKEKTRASSKYLLCMVRGDLAQTFVRLAFSPPWTSHQ